MRDSDGGGGSLSAASVDSFLSTANQGGFAVNARGGEALRQAIRNMVAWIDSQRFEFEKLQQVPKLGSSNNAEIMKPFMQQVAGDANGFVTRVLELRESLIKADEAIQAAMANYAEVEQTNASLNSEGR
ncbi:hypothetical protein V5P93_002548 [Actinokineospora auranticolor]|uniref:PE family protein n=1 Tax=Actinokineospora auranticolor TaxID=155976 RepID=A0A2S6GMF3_9PSEU|nr:hypothetical protein [Actinokineospora auranticolor]PPK66422.1 hypothetical protein CLV40_110126 [Actinokineospora auranticolor]